MERQFQINWPAIIEEAKQRRKAQRLTQAKLALMAGVSTPTISRFESGEKDIQLSSIINILTVLGMNDQRNLTFLDHDEHYEFSHRAVIFFGKEGDNVIHCGISKEAINDFFSGDGKEPLKVFQANREQIEHEARRKYLAGKLEADGSVMITSKDLG